jgi:hypothetical protein
VVSKIRYFCAIFIGKTRSFCQDKLGTNIGKTQKRNEFQTVPACVRHVEESARHFIDRDNLRDRTLYKTKKREKEHACFVQCFFRLFVPSLSWQKTVF